MNNTIYLHQDEQESKDNIQDLTFFLMKDSDTKSLSKRAAAATTELADGIYINSFQRLNQKVS